MVQWSVSHWLVQHVDVQKKIVSLTPGFLFHECLQMRIVGGRCYSFTKSSLPAACRPSSVSLMKNILSEMYVVCTLPAGLSLLTTIERVHTCIPVLCCPHQCCEKVCGRVLRPSQRVVIYCCLHRSQSRENVAPRVIWTWLRTPVSTCVCVREIVCVHVSTGACVGVL